MDFETISATRSADSSHTSQDLFHWIDEERYFLANELHRGLGQNMAALIFMMDDLLNDLKQSARNDACVETAKDIHRNIQDSVAHCGSLAAILARPDVSSGIRLHEALDALAEAVSRHCNVDCTFLCANALNPPDQAAAHQVYRLVQDLIYHDLRRHLVSKIAVRMDLRETTLSILVSSTRSNGEIPPSDVDGSFHLIECRTAMLDGTLVQKTTSKARQTRISIPWPTSSQ